MLSTSVLARYHALTGKATVTPTPENDPESVAESQLEQLFTAILKLEDVAAARDYFHDLCTPAELRAMADRWRVAKLLHQGVPYRSIYDMTGVSTATITRVARAMTYGSGGYKASLRAGDKGATIES